MENATNENEQEVLDLDGYSMDELKAMLAEKERMLAEFEETYGGKKYLVDGGLEFLDNLRTFLEEDVQVVWKGNQTNGLVKLMDAVLEVQRGILRGDATEVMFDPHTIYMTNLYIMQTTTVGYAAAVRVQRVFEAMRMTFTRYEEDAAVINRHVEVMNTIWNHINSMELEEAGALTGDDEATGSDDEAVV